MTAVNLLWGPPGIPIYLPTGNAPTAAALNDADNSIAMIFVVPKTGTINKICFNVSAFNGTPPAYNVGLVTVDASGNPTTTAYGSSGIYSWTPGGTGMAWITLSTPATGATAGDVCAVRIYPGASAPDAGNNISVTYVGASPSHTYPHIRTFTTVWSAASVGGFGIGVQYSDGSVVFAPVSSTISENIQSDTTPDELGCLFQVPIKMTCIGSMVGLAAASGGADFTVKLYDSDGSTLLGSQAIDTSQMTGAAVKVWPHFHWAGAILLPNTDYRLTVLPGEAIFGLSVLQMTVDAAASLAAFAEGSRWQRTERTDAGAWSQTATKLPMMGLLIADISGNEGGGDFSHAYFG